MEHHLHRAGLRTVWTEGGMHALHAVSMHKPDLIILDLMLPELHGLEVCRLLRMDVHTRHIPIIIVTALGTLEDELRGFGRGADDYLTKPVKMPDLIVRIFSLLRRADMTRSAFDALSDNGTHPVCTPGSSWANLETKEASSDDAQTDSCRRG
jgi:DNA-binding response OmpR family regulator